MNNPDKLKMQTPDLTAENVAKLTALFPGVVADGKVNVDLLRSYVGEEIFGDEAYEFTWVGKRAAIAEAGRPIRKTLRPCVEESRDWDTTENLYIEGDNLDVLKLLQESYLGKVKMVYIDPPYNTGSGFVYRDNFTASREDYEEEAGVYDADGGKRKFSMVQLPEVCAESSEAAKAGYTNICEIGKERIRRAGDKIVESVPKQIVLGDTVGADLRVCPGNGAQAPEQGEHVGSPLHPDTGFRVLKLADTNMNDVYYAAGDYTQDMLLLMQDNIKADRTDMDLLFGCLLDWGLPLSMPHTHEVIDGATVHTYNGGDLTACFAENVSETVVREIAKRQPLRAVFRDSSFTGSPEKINVTEIFKLLAPNTTVRVI
jgi:hypothetical protein